MHKIKVLVAAVAAAMLFGVGVADASVPERGPLVKISGAALSQQAAGSAMSEEMVRAKQSLTDLLAATDAAPAAINCYSNVSIQSNYNLNFVTTEMNKLAGEKYMLRARVPAVGSWELYTVCRDSVSGLTNIKSQASNKYVTEEEGYGAGDRHMLRAARDAFGPWEHWYTTQDPCNGCFTVFVSGHNGNYVTEEDHYTGGDKYMLRAARAAFGPWESFNW